jgi:predicted transcriptional regulator
MSGAIAQIVSNFAKRENATVEEILALAQQLPAALGSSTDQFIPHAPQAELDGHIATVQPAVAIDQSVSDGTVTCLVCGRSFTMLKRHIKAEHGLSESQYRAQFGLSDDHPLVAPNYSVRKAEYAKRIGLGKHARGSSLAPSADQSL